MSQRWGAEENECDSADDAVSESYSHFILAGSSGMTAPLRSALHTQWLVGTQGAHRQGANHTRALRPFVGLVQSSSSHVLNAIRSCCYVLVAVAAWVGRREVGVRRGTLAISSRQRQGGRG